MTEIYTPSMPPVGPASELNNSDINVIVYSMVGQGPAGRAFNYDDFTPEQLAALTGPTGAAAGFGTPTASVDNNVGIPSVEVTAVGSDTEKVFDFAFHNIKGEKGDKGDAFTFNDLTQAQINELRANITGIQLRQYVYTDDDFHGRELHNIPATQNDAVQVYRNGLLLKGAEISSSVGDVDEYTYEIETNNTMSLYLASDEASGDIFIINVFSLTTAQS